MTSVSHDAVHSDEDNYEEATLVYSPSRQGAAKIGGGCSNETQPLWGMAARNKWGVQGAGEKFVFADGAGQAHLPQIKSPTIMSEVTLILQALERGEKKSSEELVPLVYDELRRLAAVRLAAEPAGQTLQPTALVHEAWVRLIGGQAQTWENRAHFFAAAAEAMRRIMIERARRKSRIKHGGGQQRVDIEKVDVADALPDEKVLLVDEALEKLRKEDPETAQIVTLKFFGGLNNDEIAKITGKSDRTIRRQWDFAKAWLFKCMQGL